jgi:hypothetical protein
MGNGLPKPSYKQFTSVNLNENNNLQVPIINKSNYTNYSNKLFNSNVSLNIDCIDMKLPFVTYWYYPSNRNGTLLINYGSNVVLKELTVSSNKNTKYVNRIYISAPKQQFLSFRIIPEVTIDIINFSSMNPSIFESFKNTNDKSNCKLLSKDNFTFIMSIIIIMLIILLNSPIYKKYLPKVFKS